ncbi:MAG TPA: GNAT family N-acetyltransferase [Aggregatilineales bacterium]|nr:GNAT family N-acetyltransferase [Aggregatilineales bacterium]
MIALRPLREEDIANLPTIRPNYRSESVLAVQRLGEMDGWHLIEQRLPVPFDNESGYDFDEQAQAEIRARLANSDLTYQQIAEDEGRLVALLDIGLQNWNDTVFVWNLMIDKDYRRRGLGRRLWHRALEYARDMDVRAIMVETQNTNVAACKFYASMGCRLVGLNEAYYANSSDEEVALFWAYFLR